MIPDSLVIKVITLRRDTSNLPIVKQLRALFPDIPVTIQPGVDVTSQTTQELYEQGKIGIVGVLGLQRDSRTWHEDLPGPGAVGCFHAHKNALENTDGPLLLLEDDCVLQPTFKQAFDDLFERNDFDIAVFGAHIRNSYPDSHTRNSSEKGWDANRTYWNHHCVYYTDRAPCDSSSFEHGRHTIRCAHLCVGRPRKGSHHCHPGARHANLSRFFHPRTRAELVLDVRNEQPPNSVLNSVHCITRSSMRA